jgi:dihydroorotase
LNFKLAQAAIAHGFFPQAFGTDVVKLDEEQPHFYNVAAIASKFVALGLSLTDSIAAATCNPARMLNEQDKRGSLRQGMPADISILGYHEGEFLFHDGRAGNLIPGNVFLSPQMVVKNGKVILVRESFSSHIPEKPMMEELLRK